MSHGKETALPERGYDRQDRIAELENMNRALKTQLQKCEEVCDGLRRDLDSQCSTLWLRPLWLRADHDYDFPGEGALAALRRSPPKVLVWDFKSKAPSVESIEDLRDKHAVYFKLPSRIPGKVFLWVSKTEIPPPRPVPRYRMTTHRRRSSSMEDFETIHLSKFSYSARWRVFAGSIKWMFVINDMTDVTPRSTMEPASV